MKRTSPWVSRGRGIAAVALLWFVVPSSGCGWREFSKHFPADINLANRADTHPLNRVHFTFDTIASGGSRSDTGKVKFTYGDEQERFEVAGTFTVSNKARSPNPWATLAITLTPTEEQKGKYRDLVKRVKGKAKPGVNLNLPEEIPSKEDFHAQLHIGEKRPLELTDSLGNKLEFAIP
jgi:hypothetical protein